MADVRMIDAGSLIGFEPATVEAEEWLVEFVDAEAWQQGRILYVEPHEAARICDGLFDDGLSLTV
jgi:hypothetical protein